MMIDSSGRWSIYSIFECHGLLHPWRITHKGNNPIILNQKNQINFWSTNNLPLCHSHLGYCSWDTLQFIIRLLELCLDAILKGISSFSYHFGRLIYVHTSTSTSPKSKQRQIGDAFKARVLFNVNDYLCCGALGPLTVRRAGLLFRSVDTRRRHQL